MLVFCCCWWGDRYQTTTKDRNGRTLQGSLRTPMLINNTSVNEEDVCILFNGRGRDDVEIAFGVGMDPLLAWRLVWEWLSVEVSIHRRATVFILF